LSFGSSSTIGGQVASGKTLQGMVPRGPVVRETDSPGAIEIVQRETHLTEKEALERKCLGRGCRADSGGGGKRAKDDGFL